MEGVLSDRSLAPIDASDLVRLAGIAAEAEARLFARHPQGAGRYAGRLLCRALCQGAALHYLDGKNGVKDFDVWSFYAALGDRPFPYRWRGTADYGPSKFGRYPGDLTSFTGRRVDLLGRSLDAPPGAEPAAVVRGWLSAARTESARQLAANVTAASRAGPIPDDIGSRGTNELKLQRCHRLSPVLPRERSLALIPAQRVRTQFRLRQGWFLPET